MLPNGIATEGHPRAAQPPRAQGSIRRTTSIDVLHVQGPPDHVQFTCEGRDLLTGRDGHETISETSFTIAMTKPDGIVDSVVVPHSSSEVRRLVGTSLRRGFRKAVAEADVAQPGSITSQLLDDLPVALIVSGYSTAVAGAQVREQPNLDRIGVCMGWRQGGTVDLELARSGAIPIPHGPIVPAPEDHDAAAWHRLPSLDHHSVRRLRRTDVIRDIRGWRVEASFRDSHTDGTGIETVIHEYDLHAIVEFATDEIVEAIATPRVLPYLECPMAAAAVQNIIGMPASDARRSIPSLISGTASCTHLNDLLRTLADVPTLSSYLP
ncbi:DUF2889 domain-containing protein [Rhodococcus wratislaviensis]|uniref:DUF2889 domain-containing protein n=1 Tax=Rhodococcus wratislaviensis TaxID=44752 RepID=UPI000F570375|nr:DUF2889 domain-containing protein [Rhodococcus wratislaviensis]